MNHQKKTLGNQFLRIKYGTCNRTNVQIHKFGHCKDFNTVEQEAFDFSVT